MLAKTWLVMAALWLSLGAVPGIRTAHAAPALSADETADLLYTREEEKVARDTYLTLDETWKLAVFSNIASAEQSHMDAVLKLLDKYDLADPAAGNAVGVFTNPTLQSLYDTLVAQGRSNLLSALEVGGLIEETDIVDITNAVQRAQHNDIIKTYDTLMCGSRNHLRSFAASVTSQTGQPYRAQVLPQATVDAILASPMERCGNNASASASR